MDHRGITDDDIEKMMNNNKDGLTQSEPGKEQTEEEKKLMQEWEQHMHDFVPEDISTIVVDPRKEVVSLTKHALTPTQIDVLRGHWARVGLHKRGVLRGALVHVE